MEAKRMKLQINVYSPLGKGGPTTWANDLVKSLNLKDENAILRNSIPQYLLEPFAHGIIHSAVPFVYANRRSDYILTIHGDFRKENNIWGHLYPRAIKNARIITVPSIYLKDILKLKHAYVIPNGVFIKEKTPQKMIEPTLGILTSFYFPEKTRGLVDLAQILKSIDFKGKLIIAGEGPLRSKFENRVKSIFAGAEFVGYIDRERFFKQIDIYTYFSHLDIFCLSVLEAMARGLPIVSNDIGGVLEMVGPRNKTQIASNNQDYKDTLKALVANRNLRKKISNDLYTRAKEFSWNKVTEEWLKIYYR